MLTASCRDGSPGFTGPAPEGFVMIPAGRHIIGSSEQERAVALSHVLSDKIPSAQARLDLELFRHEVDLPAFAAGRYPVTMREYAEFIATTGHRAPDLSELEWLEEAQRSGLGLEHASDYAKYVRPLCWSGGKPPKGREHIPVVLVSRDDADAYCRWLGGRLGRNVRLPDEVESEALAGASAYPWGGGWEPDMGYFNTNATAPGPVGKHGGKVSKDITGNGVGDYTGQVYEWTLSPDGRRHGYGILKGGGCWLDGAADSRRAARRGVPLDTRHVLVGFRVIIAD
ncbi:MAG: formylglycine-generating enzyme family protein [Planctomycetes bacterium]|nr:formylglycine-generating enzyme family protein [Planctomycetota bacterium]